MSSLFCCGSISPFRPKVLSHEAKFKRFMRWANFPRESTLSPTETVDLVQVKPDFAVQVVRQVNYGPVEAKRYFIPAVDDNDVFVEVSENDLIRANFKKLNTFKNFRCDSHNKFFEINIYQKDPVNDHHWRSDIARPGSQIDL